jgi:hypothetical protein
MTVTDEDRALLRAITVDTLEAREAKYSCKDKDKDAEAAFAVIAPEVGDGLEVRI